MHSDHRFYLIRVYLPDGGQIQSGLVIILPPTLLANGHGHLYSRCFCTKLLTYEAPFFPPSIIHFFCAGHVAGGICLGGSH